MEVKIWPRGPKEKGGYAMMPMRKNIPVGRDGWELTQCPACGCECLTMVPCVSLSETIRRRLITWQKVLKTEGSSS